MNEREGFTCIPIDFRELEAYKEECERLNIRVLIQKVQDHIPLAESNPPAFRKR